MNADADRPWGRRLIICCDGTWQSSATYKENVPSNVTKLCRLISRYSEKKTDQDRKWHQLVYYDSGIGTGDLSDIETARQGGTGAGLEINVIEAYNFVVLNYEPGDEILCFGFSRGAYTARAVAGLMADIGVLQPLEMQFFHDIYKEYMSYGLSPNGKSGISFRESDGWTRLIKQGVFIDEPPPEASRSIKVVGVWDTVGSLGVPDIVGIDNGYLRAKYGFHNVKLSKHVDHAYHALALDERRPAFRPTLWYIDPARNTNSELMQVWFPGVHTNCGGGDPDAYTKMKGDMENISVATFTWMLQCIAPHVDLDQRGFQNYLQQYQIWLQKLRYNCTYPHNPDPNILTKAIDRVTKAAHKLFPWDTHISPASTPSTPHSHTPFYFGWGIGPVTDSYTELYRLNDDPRPRRPGNEEMEFEGEWSPIKGTPGNPTGLLTHEYIHPLVQHRYETLKKWDKYKIATIPPLEGWQRQLRVEKDGSARFWWTGRQGERLPEWCVLPNTKLEINYERAWYVAAQEMGREVSDGMEKVKVQEQGDFLTRLDGEIRFKPGLRPGNEWRL